MSSKSDSTQSSSSSTSSTTNANDQRALADNGALALAANASIQYTTQFPEQVADVFKSVVDLASGAGQIVSDTNAKLVQVAEAALNKFAAIQSNANSTSSIQQAQAEQGGAGITISSVVKYLAIGGAVIFGIVYLMKGKR